MTLKFGKPDPISEQEKLNLEENAKIASEEVIGHAQNCLNDAEFIKYKSVFIKLEQFSIDQLYVIDVQCNDPVEYGFRCKSIIGKLRILRLLLGAVHGEAGK